MKDFPVSAPGSVGTLERFLSLIDSGKLLDQRDEIFFRNIRKEVVSALKQLLVWERPQLEATRGIQWPYEELKRRYPFFVSMSEQNADEFVRRQGDLFLAFLPFPGQWARILKVENEYGEESEVRDFLLAERENIKEKVCSKPQERFKLRHFCQILKGYRSPREKGILRVFSLPYLLIDRDLLAQLSQKYVFYVEPPMGVVFRHEWWRYFSTLENPCLFGACSREDADFLAMQSRVETVSLAHGDFLEENQWKDYPKDKVYDVVFNATYDDMPRKRHVFMLELLQHPLLLHNKVLFMGRGKEASVEWFRKQVSALGLENRVTVLANLRRGEIPKWLALCKIGVHLSLYESGCRSVYEFFRSDLPCVISSSMAGMNRDIFNSHTGVAVPDKELAKTIALVLAHQGSYQPRQWFLNHSGSLNSTRKLNEFFKEFFRKQSYEWHEDIVLLGSSGANRYVYEADYERFKGEFQWILGCVQSTDNWQVRFSVE